MNKTQRRKAIAALRNTQGDNCCYCSREMYFGDEAKATFMERNGLWTRGRVDLVRVTLEHLQRRAENGTNARDNLALACAECNSGRGEMNWCEYKTFIEIRAA